MFDKAKFQAIHNQICEAVGTDFERRWQQAVGGISTRGTPERGMFVLTGPHGGAIKGSIGWIVQIRLKQGQFGTDNYILCHPGENGCWLMQHSNNHFYPLSPEEIALVRPFFADRLPENEDFSHGYTLGSAETKAVGFLIDPPEDFVPRGGEGARMRTVIIGDGKETVHETIFL